jgi:amino acid transporter
LYALAISGSAPKIFAKCTKRGIPIYAVGAIIAFGLLSFLNVGRSSTVVFGWFVNVVSKIARISYSQANASQTTISGLFNWFTLGVSYVRFRKGMEVQGISRDLMPFRGWFQPYAAWYTIIMSGTLILLNGFDVFFTGNFTVAGFFSSYSGLLLYIVP